MAAFDLTLNSLSVRSLGLEKYGFVDEPECFKTDVKFDSSPKIASQSFNSTDEGNCPLSGISVENLGTDEFGFVCTSRSHSISLYNSVFGMDKYGFIADEATYEAETTEQYFNLGSKWMQLSRGENSDECYDGGNDSLSRKLSVRNLEIESYGFVSTPDSLMKSLSVRSLGIEKYGFVSTPDSLMNSLSVKSLGLEKYGFFADDETYEAKTSDQEELNAWEKLYRQIEANSLQISSGEDQDECYERLSTSLTVNIPAPEKYEGCDIEANTFFSGNYPYK